MIVDYFEQIKEFIDSFKKDALSGEHILLEDLKDHFMFIFHLVTPSVSH